MLCWRSLMFKKKNNQHNIATHSEILNNNQKKRTSSVAPTKNIYINPMAGNSNSEKKALIKDDLAISILSNSYNRLQRLSSERTSAADNPIVSQIGYANALPMVGHLHIPWHGVVPRLYARSHPPQKKKSTSTTPLKCWLFVEDLEIPPSHGQPSTTLGNNFECNVAALNLFSYTTSNSFWGCSHFTRWSHEGLNCSSNLMPGDQNNWWCVSPCWQQRTWQPALTAHRSSLFFSSKTRTKRIQKVWIAAVKRTETVYCIVYWYHIGAFLDIMAKLESPTTAIAHLILKLKIGPYIWHDIQAPRKPQPKKNKLKKSNCTHWLCKR